MRRRSLMGRSAIRISGIFMLLLIFFCIISFYQEKSSHQKIISFIPDFLNFWQEEINKPLEKKIALWENSFDAEYLKADTFKNIHRGYSEALKKVYEKNEKEIETEWKEFLCKFAGKEA
jgi:hypothetical protein